MSVPRRWLLVSLCLALAAQAAAKEIVRGARASENRIYIRTDGLACYFCAYGLERFFEKTGKVAAFDMNMKEGLVELVLVRGEPLLGARDLNRYVHDAGFTPRWIRVELVGRFVPEGEGFAFEVAETGERLPLQMGELQVPEGAEWVRIEAKALEYEQAPFALEVERYEAVEKGRP